MKGKKFWTFQSKAKNKAELRLYGPISEDSWWGDEITPKQFSEDLDALGDIDELEVRINSGGGDVFAGQTIYALLKSHKANVTVYIDGLAASIASIIAMAGDKVVMHLGSMLMIHNPWSSVWGGESEDFRHMADVLDKIRDSLIAIYKSKTGKDESELKEMMDQTTWMTAAEAVEMGFVDEISNVSVAASYKGSFMNVNGLDFDISKFSNKPDLPQWQNTQMPKEITNQGTKTLLNFSPKEEEIVDIKDLKEKHQELYNQVFNEGIQAERDRMKAIDELAMPGFENLVNDAKYTSGISAEQLAVQIVKADKNKGNEYLAKVNDDAAQLTQVKGDGTPQTIRTDDEERNEVTNKMANFVNRKRGVK